jgi:ubiquinone/menaquinone biosynthesis C-methylase UbiE
MPLDHFDLLAPLYDRFIQYKKPEKLINLVELPFEGIILDAGGGTGRVAQWLNVNLSQIFVVDSSHSMLRQAVNKRGLDSVCSQTESLPFADDSFDRIVMVDALHHVFDQSITAQEMWRLVKPGGKIIIEEPNIKFFSVKLVAIAERLALMRSRFLSPDQIASLFSEKEAQISIENEGYNTWIIVAK